MGTPAPDAPVPGLHHVTAIGGDAQQTLDFYTGVLGLRLVKTTVNFDDPATYHLYVGDRTGQPGTILTFFPWAQAAAGRPGAGMASAVALAAPSGAVEAWETRLANAGVRVTAAARFGEAVLRVEAPDGLPLEIVGTDEAPAGAAWAGGPVGADMALRGVHSVALPALSRPHTEELFTDVFGWTRAEASGERVRLVAPEEGGDTHPPGRLVDLETDPARGAGRLGTGTVHHVAFRARSEEEQAAWQAALRERDIRVTDVKDRQYFRSIYFRDPKWTSGVLFEIATDGPGFTADEPVEALGETLQLPPWLDDRREELAKQLAPLDRSAASSAPRGT